MRGSSWALLSALGALSVAAAACAPERSPEWVGANVTHITDRSTEIELCGGQVDFADRLVESTLRTWHSSSDSAPDTRFIVELRSFDEGSGFGAARGGGFAWVAKQLAYAHEVGHLVTTQVDGASAPVFSEGMAEIIGATSPYQYYFPTVDPETFAYLQRPEFSTAEYYLSVQLLSFLARRYGLQAVRDAYRLAPPDATPDQIDEALIQAFGDGVFDAFDEFQSEPACPLMLWQCDPDVLPTVELPYALQLDPSNCADADIPGFTTSQSDDWYPEYLGVLRLDEARWIRYRVDNAEVFRQQCQQECTPREEAPPWTLQLHQEILGQTEFLAHVRPGAHHIQIRPADPQRPFSVEIEDVGPAP